MIKEGLQTPEVYNEMFKKDPTVWSAFELDEEINKIINDRYGNANIKLLDMGCGNGRTIQKINRDNIEIIGIDFSTEALKLALERNADVKFMRCDMRKTLFTDNEFDIVISVGSHEHLDKISFAEPRRLVKKNGVFICILPASKETTGWTHVRDNFWEWKLTTKDWVKKIKKFNFKVIRADGWLFVCEPI